MLQSISKYKLYLYLFFFIFLSSIFNFRFLENYQDKFSLKKININGLPYNEEKIVKNELKNFHNINILEKIYINKIIPSSINIHLSKTSIIGKTLRNGEKFYIGNNGKLINSNYFFESDEPATVFGNFKIDEFLQLQKILNNYGLEIGKIKKYYYYKNKRWDLLFSDGFTLMLPSKNTEESLKIFKQLLDNGNLLNIKIVDLRVNNQIILTKNNE